MLLDNKKSYYAFYTGDVSKDLKDNNISDFIVLNKELVVIYVDMDFEEKTFKKIKSINYYKISDEMSSLMDITNNLEKGEAISNLSEIDYIDKNPYINIRGKNTLIAIIDSGIDYLHPDFIDENKKSKIYSIWDQNKEGTHPEGMIFGAEYTNEDINNAILNNDSSLTSDDVGTGTIASGIVCSQGKLNKIFKGIATQSRIIVVKLKNYKSKYDKDKISYKNTDFLAAIKYVFDISSKLRLPIIINLTVATMSNGFNDISLIDTFDEINRSGVFIVGGAGNQGNTAIHFYDKIEEKNDIKDVIVQVGNQDALDIVIECRDIDIIGAKIISPSGEVSYTANYTPKNPINSGRFNLENTNYNMQLVYPYILTGRQRLEISLEDVKPGIWTIRLIPEQIINGEFDIYLPNKNLMSEDTRFIDPDSLNTITNYSQGSPVITVGAFNDKTDSMWLGSSKGLSTNIKPDIVAPGVDIISTFTNSSYNTATGTGVSSSIVSGIVAVIAEYLVEQSEFSRITLFSDVIKTYLMLGADKKETYIYPNVSQGYGILNLKNTIEEIANNL